MTLRIFESVFYKSLIRACSFDNSLAASQNARSYVQTIDHRALRICKKRIQKVLMLSSFFLINSSSYLLSDSYMQHYYKSKYCLYSLLTNYKYWQQNVTIQCRQNHHINRLFKPPIVYIIIRERGWYRVSKKSGLTKRQKLIIEMLAAFNACLLYTSDAADD